MSLEASLDLRRWALGVFMTEPGCPPPAPPRASVSAWRCFLKSERCAIALARRMEPHRRSGASDSTWWGLLRQGASVESRNVLAARAHLAMVSRIAEAEELGPLIVLKGGVPLSLGRDPHALADLDLLVAPVDRGRDGGPEADAELLRRRALRLASALERMGLRPSRATDREGDGAAHHLVPRSRPGSIPIELHTRLKAAPEEFPERLWKGLRNVVGLPGLWAPGSVEHAEILLRHGVQQHPDRRGSLRELLLLADTVPELGARGIQAVRDRVGEDPGAGPLLEQFETAIRMVPGTGGPTTGGVPRASVARGPTHEAAAVTHFLVGEIQSGRASRRMALSLSALLLHHLGEPGEFPSPWERRLAGASRTPGWLRRRAPAVDRAMRGAMRMGWLAAMDLPARLLAGPVRRAAQGQVRGVRAIEAPDPWVGSEDSSAARRVASA